MDGNRRKMIIQAIIMVIVIFIVLRYWGFIVKGLYIVLDAIKPLIIGAVIAYIVNIVMKFYEDKLLYKMKRKRVLSMVMAYGSIIFVLILVLMIVVPELKSCVEILIKSIPSSLDVMQKYLDKLNVVVDGIDLSDVNWEKSINKVVSWGTKGVGTTVETVIGYVSSIVSVLMNFIMGLIFSMYILYDKEKLKRQSIKIMETYFSEKMNRNILYVVNILDNSFHSFIVGQTIEAVILGVLCIIGMLIFGFPYAVMIGVFIGCTALIPIAGAYIGGAVGVIMIFTVSPFKAIMFIVFLVILQQFESQLIYPRVVGSSIGLPGMWVFAAVIVGGSTYGILGILLGIPVFSAVYQIIINDVSSRNVPDEEDDGNECENLSDFSDSGDN